MTTAPGSYPDAFPWLRHLDTEDQAALLLDLSNITTITDLNRTVHEWANTAIALADPQARAALFNKDEPGDAQ